MKRRDLLRLSASAATAPALGIARRDHFFQMLKRMMAQIYYATHIGFNELNNGSRVPATFGCQHPEHA